MAHIELSQFSTHGTSDNIFTANLTLDPTVKDTIIRTIKDGGDKQHGTESVQALMTNYFMQKEPGFVELEEEITSIVNYLPNIFWKNRGAHPIVEISAMWGLLYKKNDYCNVHSHWPSIWSGVFYLDIPTDYAGTLFFPELEHHIEPITGQLVIFSGVTMHGVKTIQSNGERLAISFNYHNMVGENRLPMMIAGSRSLSGEDSEE
jgi:hypothetical protein